MIKTIIISVLILVVLNYIIHFLKDSFTQPIVKYLDDPKPKEKSLKNPPIVEIQNVELKEINVKEMKDELNEFLMEII